MGYGVGALAESCSVSRETQRLFEHGANLPGGAYLIAAAGLGIDIQYVLIGQHAQNPPAQSIHHVSMDRGSVIASGNVTVGNKPRRRRK